MTRFVFIADTHFGADPMGFQQQKGYPCELGQIVAMLDEWIRKDGGIDFVLHGGDMIDNATEANIRKAGKLFRFSVPVYLCMGNHDLTDPYALKMWVSLAPEFFPDGKANFSVQSGDCVVHVVSNQWCDTPYYWDLQCEQKPYFLSDQREGLEKALAKHPKAVHIFSTHSPVLGVPPQQTGFDEPYHVPTGDFSETVLGLVQRHPQIRCVLSAHSHINMHVEERGVHFVTVSGLVEAPFEFKVIEVESGTIRMSTANLVSQVGFKTEYDYDKTWVQGCPKDRAFEDHYGQTLPDI